MAPLPGSREAAGDYRDGKGLMPPHAVREYYPRITGLEAQSFPSGASVED